MSVGVCNCAKRRHIGFFSYVVRVTFARVTHAQRMLKFWRSNARNVFFLSFSVVGKQNVSFVKRFLTHFWVRLTPFLLRRHLSEVISKWDWHLSEFFTRLVRFWNKPKQFYSVMFDSLCVARFEKVIYFSMNFGEIQLFFAQICAFVFEHIWMCSMKPIAGWWCAFGRAFSGIWKLRIQMKGKES